MNVVLAHLIFVHVVSTLARSFLKRLHDAQAAAATAAAAAQQVATHCLACNKLSRIRHVVAAAAAAVAFPNTHTPTLIYHNFITTPTPTSPNYTLSAILFIALTLFFVSLSLYFGLCGEFLILATLCV